ncbi:hypothetical protein BKA61DRAFT_721036 [Leptodontidium sp. MPI-SDFR-AT-0119]|nr:hypothetical protein BKA61DRAFT_721036 [Leptodontidium sp. MPI-SDFR-AT-0119]
MAEKRAANSDSESGLPKEKKSRTSNPKVMTDCTTCKRGSVECDERDSCGQCKTNCECPRTATWKCVIVQPLLNTEPAATPPSSSTEISSIDNPPDDERPLDFQDPGLSSNRDVTHAEDCRDLQSQDLIYGIPIPVYDSVGATTEGKIKSDHGWCQTDSSVVKNVPLLALESGFPPSESSSETLDSKPIDDPGCYTDSDAPATFAMSDTHRKLVQENGRKYHADVWDGLENWEPLDEVQINCHALSHDVWKSADEGRLCRAPFRRGANVLDIGTGSGTWAIQFADNNDSCNALGIDICPMQPVWLAANVEFELDNFDSPDYEEQQHRYDYIHGRGLGGSVTNWPRLLGTAFRYGLEQSGRWIELAQDDIHLTHNDGKLDPMLGWWVKEIIRAGKKSKKSFDICGRLEEWVEGAGFINVKKIIIPVPVGCAPDSPDQLGMLNQERLLMELDGRSYRPLIGTLGMNANSVKIALAGVRRELKNVQNVHQNFTIVIGQKPWG